MVLVDFLVLVLKVLNVLLDDLLAELVGLATVVVVLITVERVGLDVI